MQKTMKFFAMAALVLTGVVMAGCTSGELVEEQPEIKSKTVTLTTKVGLGASTKALTTEGEKTFAAGETMALVYKDIHENTVMTVSRPLGASDIDESGLNATFTFTVVDPEFAEPVSYIYPAAMAGSDGSINYSALDSQDGTLATLASSLDLATFHSNSWGGGSLPRGILENQLAICAFTLKDYTGTDTITNGLTQLVVDDGNGNVYTVKQVGSAPFDQSVIYVAIKPVTTATSLKVTATDGTTNYTKTLSSRQYLAGNGYNISLKMYEVWASNQYYEGAWDDSKVVFTKQSAGSPITEITNDFSGTITSGWYTVTGDNVVIDGSVCWTGDTYLILCDGAKLTVKGYIYGKGNSYGEGNFYIFGQHAGTGTLNVYNVNDSGQGAIAVDNMLQIHGGNINVSGWWAATAGLFVKHNNAVVFGGKLTVENTKPVGVGAAYGIQMLGGDLNVYGGEVIASSRNTAISIGNMNKSVTVFGGKLMAINPVGYLGYRAIDGYVKSGVSGIKFYFSIDAEIWSDGDTYAEAARAPDDPYVKAE